MTVSATEITHEQPEHLPVIDDLLDAAFGPGRFAKTAYRLREEIAPVPELSFVAVEGGNVIGSVRYTEIAIGPYPALLLGPLVVRTDYKNRGYGLRLMRTSLDAAHRLGHSRVILVGDEPYYARAGFARLPAGTVQLPGPVDPARLLGLALETGAFEGVEGTARPAPKR